MSRLFPYRSTRSTRVLLWLGVGYALLSLGHLTIQEVRLLHKGRILRSERTVVDAKGIKLQEAIQEAQTPRGIERLARENLGMTKVGEIPIRFIPSKDASRTW